MLPSSFPPVAALPKEGTAELFGTADDPAFVPKENLGAEPEADGAVEVVAELLPKEKPGVVALAVDGAVAESLPNEKVGAAGLLTLSFVVELPKLKPFLLSTPAAFRFCAGSAVDDSSVSFLEVELVSLFVPKLNTGAGAEVEPVEVVAAKLPNKPLAAFEGLEAVAASSFWDEAGAALKENGFVAAGAGDGLGADVDSAVGAAEAPNWNPPDAAALPDEEAGAPNLKPPVEVEVFVVGVDDDFDGDVLPN